MISKIKFNMVAALILAFGVFAGAAVAQDTATPKKEDNVQKQQKFERRGGRFGRGDGFHGGMHRGGLMGMLRGIDLTDAQKQQIKAILEANKPDLAAMEQMKTLREARKSGTELTAEQKAQLKSARQAQRAKMQLVHEQILNVLTAEQKQQLEQRRQEMRQRRELQRENKAAPTKPTDN